MFAVRLQATQVFCVWMKSVPESDALMTVALLQAGNHTLNATDHNSTRHRQKAPGLSVINGAAAREEIPQVNL